MGCKGFVKRWTCDVCQQACDGVADDVPENWLDLSDFDGNRVGVLCVGCLDAIADYREALKDSLAISLDAIGVCLARRAFIRNISNVGRIVNAMSTDDCDAIDIDTAYTRARRLGVEREEVCKDEPSTTPLDPTPDSSGSAFDRVKSSSPSGSPTKPDSDALCTETPSDTPPSSPST